MKVLNEGRLWRYWRNYIVMIGSHWYYDDDLIVIMMTAVIIVLTVLCGRVTCEERGREEIVNY